MDIEDYGNIGVFCLIILILLVPVFVIFYAGSMVANYMGLTGFNWWICVILFYLIVGGLLSALDRVGR